MLTEQDVRRIAYNVALESFQTLLTNSAGLRAALSDETGTGAAVFANTPTLATPVLTAPTATTIVASDLVTGLSFKSGAPAGGTSGTWKLGVAAEVTPTLPNRTLEVDIGGTIYYVTAKTTND